MKHKIITATAMVVLAALIILQLVRITTLEHQVNSLEIRADKFEVRTTQATHRLDLLEGTTNEFPLNTNYSIRLTQKGGAQ
jgi:hypothetical protein